MACRGEEEDAHHREASRITYTYSPPVKIGNWNNMLAIEESRENLAAYKKAHCQLLVAKTRAMLRNLLEPTSLAETVDNIEYGHYYQMCASELPNSIEPTIPQKKGLYLSALLNEHDIDHGIDLMHGCMVTASPDRTACKRNTFFFKSAENKTGSINYGEDLFIMIQPHDPDTPPLYLQAEYNTMDTFGSHIFARLSASPDVYCHFKILHWNGKMRKYSMGGKITPNTNVIVQHIPTGRNLAAENVRWIPTFFGPECLVTCHTFQNPNRVETAENMWKIVNKRQLDKGIVMRAAKGENIPPELLE